MSLSAFVLGAWVYVKCMLFNSFSFLLFFPTVVACYFWLPQKYRWLLLLLASCFFYASFIPAYIFILFASIVIDYIAAIWMENTEGKRKKQVFIATILLTCSPLFVFKYFNFFNSNIEWVANALDWNYSIESLYWILPIGLSFHTFQSLSYIIEVYWGKQKAERHLGIFAVYVMFFPQLVAGPIERPGNLLHQFYKKHEFVYARVVSGLKLMGWGLFKKVVIANQIAKMVDGIYGSPHDVGALSLAVATGFFAFQIYCDFSGYSDMAIGAARVMGFTLMENFDRPYFSKSVSEFWRRWHISLFDWFKDYIYIPLGGSRVTLFKWCRNIMIVFLVSGLWHGANWTFVIWGGMQGFFIIASRFTGKISGTLYTRTGLTKLPSVIHGIKVATTFFLICFSWIFFRANNLGDALYIVRHIGAGFINGIRTFPDSIHTELLTQLFMGRYSLEFVVVAASVFVMLGVEFRQREKDVFEGLVDKQWWIRWSLYYIFALWVLFFGVFDTSPFIYFQF